ncbi:hypothetical protein [Pelovirga terrestris]|uniref:DUF3887 domain-containing protein n=1 Tax=Pelovirga terrestris TaxID=2771352 RepID=A0A8J6ULQ0_9BACT|nr:hypothetical protein [Pelovirga terrestris]MBD1401537.1 hypothetical protein [Pelovirga terrestris]
MKKLIIYALFVISTAIGIYFGYGYMQGKRFDPTVIPYVEQAIPQLSRWDVAATRALLDEEALKRVSDDDLAKMMDYLTRIGELQSFDKPSFRSTSKTMTTGAIERDVVTYRVMANYSSGPAEITLSLVDRSGAYTLLHFNFQSQALAP